MDNSTLFVTYIVAAGLALAILFFIIQNAVRMATKELTINTRTSARATVLDLRKRGFTMDEISSILVDNDGEFSDRLRNTRSPEAQEEYDKAINELKKRQA